MSPKVPIHFVSALWGAAFSRTFSEVTLAALLAPGNIPAAARDRRCIYRIYTTGADRDAIQASEPLAALSRLVEIEFKIIPAPRENKYQAASSCYMEALERAAAQDAAIVFLIPDMILADGGLKHIADRLDSGARAVLVQGVRTVKERMIADMQAGYRDGPAIRVPPRELVATAVKHLHPLMRYHMYDDSEVMFHPSILCWPVGDEGFLMHGFHLQPVAIYPRGQVPRIHSTIDDDLLDALQLRDEEVYVVHDSDDLVWFELSDPGHAVGMPAKKNMAEVLRWMRKATSKYHRRCVAWPIRMHAGSLDSSRWKEVEQRGRHVVATLLGAFELEQSSYSIVDDLARNISRKDLVALFLKVLEVRARTYLRRIGLLKRGSPK
jgi:hypothetical protein